MEPEIKTDILLNLLNRIDRAIKSSDVLHTANRCPHCQYYRFDPMLNREEASAYTGFAKGSLATFDSTKRYNLYPLKFDNAVRYHLSSLNRFGDEHLRPW